LPVKTVSVPMKVQFTCEIKEIAGVAGRADIKAIKAIVAKVHFIEYSYITNHNVVTPSQKNSLNSEYFRYISLILNILMSNMSGKSVPIDRFTRLRVSESEFYSGHRGV